MKMNEATGKEVLEQIRHLLENGIRQAKNENTMKAFGRCEAYVMLRCFIAENERAILHGDFLPERVAPIGVKDGD